MFVIVIDNLIKFHVILAPNASEVGMAAAALAPLGAPTFVGLQLIGGIAGVTAQIPGAHFLHASIVLESHLLGIGHPVW